MTDRGWAGHSRGGKHSTPVSFGGPKNREKEKNTGGVVCGVRQLPNFYVHSKFFVYVHIKTTEIQRKVLDPWYALRISIFEVRTYCRLPNI